MGIEQTAKKLEGLQTIDTIAKLMGVSRRTAINIAWRLRKKGLAQTGYGKRKIRLYRISRLKKPENGFEGIYDIINKNSKVKLFTKEVHKIHYHKLTIEEAIVRAIKTEDFRTILSSLGLFNKVRDWSGLLEFAKKEQLTHQLGALYDVSKTAMKVRKMDKRVEKALLRGKTQGRYIIRNIRSKDFKDIEKKWKLSIPFNKADLEVYKE